MFVLKPDVGVGPYLNYYAKETEPLFRWREPPEGYCFVVRVLYVGRVVLHALPNEKVYREVMGSIGCRTRKFFAISLDNINPVSKEVVKACVDGEKEKESCWR